MRAATAATTRVALITAALSILAGAGAPADAQRAVTNRHLTQYTYVAEPVEGTAYVRLRGSVGHVNNETGALVVSPVQPGWWSAMWEAEPVDGTYFRLKNRWTGTYLNAETGPLLVGAVQPGWWSAMWFMADGGPMIGGAAAAAVAGPELDLPFVGAIMDNACDGADRIEWAFHWRLVPGASQYQLWVAREGSMNPAVNQSVPEQRYTHVARGGYVASHNLTGWGWRVRAQVGAGWSEWSETRAFQVEPPGTDCS